MAFSSQDNLSSLLSDASNPDYFAELIRITYTELRRIAAHYFKRERPDHTLQPTALVHEVFVRLALDHPDRYENRAQFFGIAAKVMRRLLIEHSRRHDANKRGGQWERVTFDGLTIAGAETPDYLALHQALDRLQDVDRIASRIVELRYFAGLTVPETAELLDLAESTVGNHWRFAKAWLESELGDVVS